MHAIFLDSIFGMTMCVSLCGYMKWINLNNLINLERCFALLSNQWGHLMCLLLGAAIFINNVLITLTSDDRALALLNSPLAY